MPSKEERIRPAAVIAAACDRILYFAPMKEAARLAVRPGRPTYEQATIAFNLTRAAATLTGNTLPKATTGTIRRKLIGLPARIASSVRHITLHLPKDWPWENPWTKLFADICGPPAAVTT